MGEVLEAVIRDLGRPPYADGAPQLEINCLPSSPLGSLHSTSLSAQTR